MRIFLKKDKSSKMKFSISAKFFKSFIFQFIRITYTYTSLDKY